MEVLFGVFTAIFSIITVVFGVRNRIRNTKLGDGSDIRNSRERLDNIIHDHQQLERDKERVEELDARDADSLRECSRIGERIRKKEPETDATE